MSILSQDNALLGRAFLEAERFKIPMADLLCADMRWLTAYMFNDATPSSAQLSGPRMSESDIPPKIAAALHLDVGTTNWVYGCVMENGVTRMMATKGFEDEFGYDMAEQDEAMRQCVSDWRAMETYGEGDFEIRMFPDREEYSSYYSCLSDAIADQTEADSPGVAITRPLAATSTTKKTTQVRATWVYFGVGTTTSWRMTRLRPVVQGAAAVPFAHSDDGLDLSEIADLLLPQISDGEGKGEDALADYAPYLF